MTLLQGKKLLPIRGEHDQIAGLDTEWGLVKVVFKEVEHDKGKPGTERFETMLDPDAARTLGAQLIAAADGNEAWNRPAVRIDVSEKLIADIVRKEVLKSVRYSKQGGK